MNQHIHLGCMYTAAVYQHKHTSWDTAITQHLWVSSPSSFIGVFFKRVESCPVHSWGCFSLPKEELALHLSFHLCWKESQIEQNGMSAYHFILAVDDYDPNDMVWGQKRSTFRFFLPFLSFFLSGQRFPPKSTCVYHILVYIHPTSVMPVPPWKREVKSNSFVCIYWLVCAMYGDRTKG